MISQSGHMLISLLQERESVEVMMRQLEVMAEEAHAEAWEVATTRIISDLRRTRETIEHVDRVIDRLIEHHPELARVKELYLATPYN